MKEQKNIHFQLKTCYTLLSYFPVLAFINVYPKYLQNISKNLSFTMVTLNICTVLCKILRNSIPRRARVPTYVRSCNVSSLLNCTVLTEKPSLSKPQEMKVKWSLRQRLNFAFDMDQMFLICKFLLKRILLLHFSYWNQN